MPVPGCNGSHNCAKLPISHQTIDTREIARGLAGSSSAAFTHIVRARAFELTGANYFYARSCEIAPRELAK